MSTSTRALVNWGPTKTHATGEKKKKKKRLKQKVGETGRGDFPLAFRIGSVWRSDRSEMVFCLSFLVGRMSIQALLIWNKWCFIQQAPCNPTASATNPVSTLKTNVRSKQAAGDFMHRYLCYKLNFPRLHLLSCTIKGAGGGHVSFHACIKGKKSLKYKSNSKRRGENFPVLDVIQNIKVFLPSSSKA